MEGAGVSDWERCCFLVEAPLWVGLDLVGADVGPFFSEPAGLLVLAPLAGAAGVVCCPAAPLILPERRGGGLPADAGCCASPGGSPAAVPATPAWGAPSLAIPLAPRGPLGLG